MSHEISKYYQVYNENNAKARKAHKCNACDEMIQVGHLYCRVFIVYEDGEIESLKRCARCQEIHEHLRDRGDGVSWPDERLSCGERYEDVWGELPPEIARLAFALPGDAPPSPRGPTKEGT